LDAVEDVFDAAIVYAMLVKVYGTPKDKGRPLQPRECIGTEMRRVVIAAHTGRPYTSPIENIAPNDTSSPVR
jgi:hypothetical protein